MKEYQKNMMLFILHAFILLPICAGVAVDKNAVLAKLTDLESELTVLQSDFNQYEDSKENDAQDNYDDSGENYDLNLLNGEDSNDEGTSTFKRQANGGANTFTSCGFQGECRNYFRYNSTGSVQWKRYKSDRTVTDRIDPQGYSMQAKVTSGNNKQQYAFMSITFDIEATEQCGEFYYYMYKRDGCDVARFLVTLKCDDKNVTEEIFRSSSSGGMKWNRFFVDIKRPIGTECQITWRVSKGLSRDGAVHVDDVTMHYQACPKPGSADFPSDATCLFTKDNCKWQQSGIPWSRTMWSTPTFYTGPDRYYGSHRQNAYYLYLESTKPNYPHKSALLTSQPLESSIPYCMRFMYNMYGANIGSLEVFIISGNDNKTVFKKEGNQEKQWHEGWVELPVGELFKIQFEATSGDGPRSDIAIDDILIKSGKCPASQPIIGSCSYDGNGECSYTNHFCNNTNVQSDGNYGSFNHATEITPIRNKVIGTIPKISKEWELSLDVKPRSNNGWRSIVTFKEGLGRCCNVGERVPGILFRPTNRLHICYALNNYGNRCYDTRSALPVNQYTNIKLQQKKLSNGKYHYTIDVGNGKFKINQTNNSPEQFSDVKVFASNRYHTQANAYIKNIAFKNLVAFDPCTLLCRASLKDENVDGKAVKTITYSYHRCKKHYFYNEIDLPNTVRTPRGACLSFKYRVGGGNRCHIEVHYRKSSDNFRRRVFHRIYDSYEKGYWVTVRRNFDESITSGVKYKIGVAHKLSTSCTELSFAEMKLMDGFCTKPTM